MTFIFEGKPPKTMPFPTKTRVIWVPGISNNQPGAPSTLLTRVSLNSPTHHPQQHQCPRLSQRTHESADRFS